MATYGIHLPESWWAQCASPELPQQLTFLAEKFPDSKVAIVPRSHRPILTNDPLYLSQPYDHKRDHLLGPVFKDDLVYALLGESEELAKAAKIGGPLNWSYERIEALDLESLLTAPRIKQHRENVDSIKQAGKRPWGWINVPGILQVAWTLRGEAFLGDLHLGKEAAMALLKRSVEIVRRGYALHVSSFDQPVDARLLHMPLCFLGMAGSPPLLNKLKPLYLSVRDYLLKLNGGLCRVHVCFPPNGPEQQLLSLLGMDEFEAPAIWVAALTRERRSQIAKRWVHLLASNAFASNYEERGLVGAMFKQGLGEFQLYDMDDHPDEVFLKACLADPLHSCG